MFSTGTRNQKKFPSFQNHYFQCSCCASRNTRWVQGDTSLVPRFVLHKEQLVVFTWRSTVLGDHGVFRIILEGGQEHHRTRTREAAQRKAAERRQTEQGPLRAQARNSAGARHWGLLYLALVLASVPGG